MKNKFLLYFAGMIISIIVSLVGIFIFMFFNNVLFFNALKIAFLSALIGGLFWYKYNKDKFELFVVTVSYIFCTSMFIYLGPVTVDRSLSSFIYFYSAENGSIPTHILDKEYFEPFVARRFSDGELIGMLKCDENHCEPRIKAKILYYILYPLSQITKTNKNYEIFRDNINNRI